MRRCDRASIPAIATSGASIHFSARAIGHEREVVSEVEESGEASDFIEVLDDVITPPKLPL